MSKVLHSIPPAFLPFVTFVLLIEEFFLAFYVFPQGENEILRFIGWGLWLIGAIVGVLPIWFLKKYGKAQKGLETKNLVKEGIYSIVRHPQHLSAIILHLTLVLVSQRLELIILASFAIFLIYLDTLKEDKYCKEKFGRRYKKYMKEVPRLNIVEGIFKRVL